MSVIMDVLDTIWGFFNYFPKIIGLVRTTFWISGARNKQAHSKYATVTYSFPRKDKGGLYDYQDAITHLETYGVDVVWWNYDARYWYVAVRKNQGEWARKLMGASATGGKFWHPKSSWNGG